MIDRIEICVRGGDGGDGVVSFRREKFVPFGGPNGGDGGDGGSIFLIADGGKTTLSDLRRQRYYRAGRGGHGRGKNQHGRRGKDLVLKVPLGTIIRCLEGGEEIELGDLTMQGQVLMVAKGGRGGWGNTHFATSVNRVPRIAQRGEIREEKRLLLDLKLLADVGLVGYPNVGKSTLLNGVSAARSKVASYPFTTIEPVLGVVELGYHAFVIADIPGLIEGAHCGRGLGYDFLRHIERTRILIHVIDGSTENPISDFHRVNEELSLFNLSLKGKPQLVAVNKIDLPSVRMRLPELKDQLAELDAPFYFISAATGEGVADLMGKTAELLTESEPKARAVEFKVFRPKAMK